VRPEGPRSAARRAQTRGETMGGLASTTRQQLGGLPQRGLEPWRRTHFGVFTVQKMCQEAEDIVRSVEILPRANLCLFPHVNKDVW